MLALLLVLIASARIVATYTVFNHTADEPAHIAAGMQWLDKHAYTYEPQHPPLARLAAAIGPYLLGIRSQGTPGTGLEAESLEGAKILYSGHHYDLTLAMARLGILPFFWVACLVVYVWAKRYYGGAVATIAVFFFSFLPPILAHAGLATTDMALTAFLGAVFLTALRWAESPTWKHGVLFGLCTGLAVISKFSALVFFPAAVTIALAGYLVLERPAPSSLVRIVKERLPSGGLAIATGALVIAAVYGFSLSPLFAGIHAVQVHNAEGHPTYLLGQRSTTGFWYFYPVILAVKTPLALLVVLGIGLWNCRQRSNLRRHWPVLAFVTGILLVALFSRINIGVRHILPVYIGFSLLAAAPVPELLQRGRTHPWIRAALGLLAIWFAGSSLWCHPDYLAYTNELAGSAPEKVLADSDLDWGQDMKRLSARLRQVGATQVTFDPIVLADFEGELGFPKMAPSTSAAMPAPGWNAVSISLWKVRRLGLLDSHPEITPWPDRVPPGERVGKGVMLWYFPPRAGQQR